LLFRLKQLTSALLQQLFYKRQTPRWTRTSPLFY
jgi:hypothetical protein